MTVGVRWQAVRARGHAVSSRHVGATRHASRARYTRGTRHLPESGSAVVEFVLLTVLLTIPLIYLLLTLARIQAGAYAVSTAAREAGRAYVTSVQVRGSEARAQAAASLAFEDQGFSPSEATVSMRCDGAPCLRPDGRIEVTARVTVPLPLVPSFARGVVPLEIPITSSHVAVVDRFRGAP